MSNHKPVVWYIAAGYLLPAGIEAYLLHYATELRKHGFDTRIYVFQPLPKRRHRYLKALEEQGIPIQSLYTMSAFPALARIIGQWAPWLFYTLLYKHSRPETGAFRSWQRKRCAVDLLSRLIAEQKPDIIHVKGRIISEAFRIFPSSCTVYQHALMGTVDSSWTAPEVQEFRNFANRIACIFAQGNGVAETLAREFNLNRPIERVFTMAPDEVGSNDVQYYSEHRLVTAKLDEDGTPNTHHPHPGRHVRFGILCRFTEQKGISHILEALRLFKERHGDVDFTFAGQGPLERLIREFADVNGLRNVRIVRVESPPQALAAIDVFVHPGLDDAMPVSIVEALMCGRPCIGTRVGGVPDLIRDGIEGFLIEPGSAEQILAAMERFAAMSDQEIIEFQKRARVRYEEACRPEVVGGTVAEHYRSIIAQA